jgi:uncharacterized protein YciI
MKRIDRLLMLLITILFIGCSSPADKSVEETSQDDLQGFDEQLAEELGADDYGMKQYVMAFLKAGPNQSMDSTRAANLQRAHLDNIGRLAEEGKLILAGPFMDSGEMRGIYVFDVRTIEEARELTETDPAIEAGRLEMELRPWYGSAALMQVNEIHSKISKTNP